ncbi:hypothetical protein AB1N83_008285 [Pleurotus pulmonarius]
MTYHAGSTGRIQVAKSRRRDAQALTLVIPRLPSIVGTRVSQHVHAPRRYDMSRQVRQAMTSSGSISHGFRHSCHSSWPGVTVYRNHDRYAFITRQVKLNTPIFRPPEEVTKVAQPIGKTQLKHTRISYTEQHRLQLDVLRLIVYLSPTGTPHRRPTCLGKYSYP